MPAARRRGEPMQTDGVGRTAHTRRWQNEPATNIWRGERRACQRSEPELVVRFMTADGYARRSRLVWEKTLPRVYRFP
jgi:hypothetical protein